MSSCIAGPSRSVFRHRLPLALVPTVLPSRPLPSAPRYFTASSTSRSDSRRQAYTLAQPISDSGGFEGIPAAAYVGNVETASIGKGKGKEVDPHAAPQPVAPPVPGAKPAVERKRVIKAKKAAITMTPAALDRLRALVSNPTPQLLRIGVKTRGCAGMAYHLDYVSPPGGKFDEVVEQDGVRVLIDSKALFSIIGSKMDWRDNRLSAGFVFDNPNIEDSCGCGESFNVRA
ncbi:uncharacterized protein MKK02DRAFT_43229 [Dioszegia hungarica]|uniref:Iron-sulfur assembly protein 1 n=1 Tax=Dioszegia hungarica TaxID=4972 RepID=A0AA38LXG7_9TREE|nr:uncharacterized protein MKK02DRAFT_43229 [Dioszegia hungarica]KAI9637306.1 hypothetical protein MKK02DRAFT_43229 [Dioszegia hungarica]